MEFYKLTYNDESGGYLIPDDESETTKRIVRELMEEEPSLILEKEKQCLNL